MKNKTKILIIPRNFKDESYRFAKTWKKFGAIVYLIPRINIKKRYINFILNFLNTLKYGLFKNYDIIFCYEPMQTISGYFISLIKRKPMVCYIVDNAVNLKLSDMDKSFLFYPIYNKIQNYFLKKSDYIFLIDDSLKDWLKNIGYNLKNVKTIIYGVNINRFKPKISKNEFFKKYNIPEDKILITYAGGIQKHHGFELLMKISKKLCENYNNILILIASGIKFDQIKKYNKCIKLLGWLDFNDYSCLLNYSDILICPPNPKYPYVSVITNKLLHYFATGNAIVATNIGGIKNYIINKQTGILVKPNPNDLFNGIKILVENRNLRELCGQNAKKLAIKKLNWDNNLKKILKILEIIVKK